MFTKVFEQFVHPDVIIQLKQLSKDDLKTLTDKAMFALETGGTSALREFFKSELNVDDDMNPVVTPAKPVNSYTKKIIVKNAEAYVTQDGIATIYVNCPGCAKSDITTDISDDGEIVVNFKYRNLDKSASIIVDTKIFDLDNVTGIYENGQLTLTLNKLEKKSSNKKVTIL